MNGKQRNIRDKTFNHKCEREVERGNEKIITKKLIGKDSGFPTS